MRWFELLTEDKIDDNWSEIVRRLEAGETAYRIATDLGVNATILRRRLLKRNLSRFILPGGTPFSIPDSLLPSILDDLKSKGITEVAENIGYSDTTLIDFLRRHGHGNLIRQRKTAIRFTADEKAYLVDQFTKHHRGPTALFGDLRKGDPKKFRHVIPQAISQLLKRELGTAEYNQIMDQIKQHHLGGHPTLKTTYPKPRIKPPNQPKRLVPLSHDTVKSRLMSRNPKKP